MSILDFLRQLFVSTPQETLDFWIEMVGIVTGIAAVWLIAKERIVGWPIGLINLAVYVYIFWINGFVSDAVLSALFIPMQLYGWWKWVRSRHETAQPFVVERLGERDALRWFVAGVVITLLWGMNVVFWLPGRAVLAWHDASILVASLIAQYLMARRYIECWLIWVFVDIVSPLNYLDKHLYPSAVLYLVYLGLAVVGWRAWKRTLEGQGSAERG